jgi:hypothetical protein
MQNRQRHPVCSTELRHEAGSGSQLGMSSVIAIASNALLGLVILAGCGPTTDRKEVSGKVTLDGVPLDGGSIRFSSTGEKKMSSGAMVNDGQYEIPRAKGLLPGTYRVELNAPDDSVPPVAVRTPGGGSGGLAAPERIPSEYNDNSKHTIDVTADGDNQFDFEVVSKPGK